MLGVRTPPNGSVPRGCAITTAARRLSRRLRDGSVGARFCRLGFPTTSDEEWRFTSVAPIADGRFVAGSTPPLIAERVHRPRSAPHRRMSRAELVFVNGHYAPRCRVAGRCRPALVSRAWPRR